MKTFAFVVTIIIALPGAVLAHASPVEMSPDSGENVTDIRQVSIRFSERLEQNSSRIRVTNEAGQSVDQGKTAVSQDLYSLSVPVEVREGIYTVAWSVVSQDDGHFTKGAYAFAVGSSSVSLAAESKVVKVTSLAEVTAIFIEFVGNSILWGVFVLLITAIRPIHANLDRARERVYRLVRALVVSGVSGVFAGGLLQVVIKARELAELHSIVFTEAVPMYLGTAAGESTLWRSASIVGFGFLFFAFRKRMLTGKLSWRDLLLSACLIVFAYFRASISHATANPFFPEISLFVNFVHLIDKDLWLGILIVLVSLFLASLHDVLRVIIPRAFSILALNLAAIAITASYIVWLHLQSFGNLFSTEWGENFVMLGASAALLVILRVYHTLSLRGSPDIFNRWVGVSLPAEMTASVLVIFFTSLVIITSPPAHAGATKVFTYKESGTVISLETSPTEDESALLLIKGEHLEPIVRVGGGEGSLLVPLAERFSGGYTFPLALIRGKDTAVEIIVPRTQSYDARATFNIHTNDFVVASGHGRTFDLFTGVVVIIAALGFGLGVALEYFGKRYSEPNIVRTRAPLLHAAVGACCFLLCAFFFVRGAALVFANDFKAMCVADGNMWHMMQPMKAGVPVSKTPREGCMLASGTYHFADGREYEYLRSLPQADVSFVFPADASPLVPTRFSFDITEQGAPAILSIEHEKIVHVLIVSEDMRYFAHVHPEDTGSVDVAKGHFSVEHAFPEAGKYIIALDYLHGLTHESKRFIVSVGEDTPALKVAKHPSPQRVGEYTVELDAPGLFAERLITMRFLITQNGIGVMDMEPYLGAAMHVAAVKDDLSEFIHTHGEVHPPGYVPLPNAKNHQHTPPPARFGPVIEAHIIFPAAGTYTVFGEFRHHGQVYSVPFTVHVD